MNLISLLSQFPRAVLLIASLVPAFATAAFSGTNFRLSAQRNSASALFGGYNSDVAMGGKFWNRETSVRGDFSGPVVREARILALADPHDPDNIDLYTGNLPEGARLLAVGATAADFDVAEIKTLGAPNVLFVSHAAARGPLREILENFPTICWIHSRSAGVDFITSDCLARSSALLTNAKGMYSSTLAEYSMMACSYFAKDLPRLMRQKCDNVWQKYDVLELRGATFGVVGYGDIGRACAKLANAYGMKVVALRRNPAASMYDPYCDKIYGMNKLDELMAESDYILCAAPLTEATRGMVGKDAFSAVKEGAVIINVGRGPVIDEKALIMALGSGGRLKGAALDVTTIEPLPRDSLLWEMENVLLSPHNMDMTATFMKESTHFFLEENLPRFMRELDLYNPVDKTAGY
eukprot:CAMPEP_0194333936 /NCGR_PEP_ID=MMETSP0171-20130528/64400_1 /TAXON_ID=218684 /ORGANISM="Corethron pennatum, Strain L29A3" /LENGTH=407 /DNA_ID=CAMNT_0039096369 /DNA_START=63 /DNA_END=1286 /DNA_ORIENTATION=+